MKLAITKQGDGSLITVIFAKVGLDKLRENFIVIFPCGT